MIKRMVLEYTDMPTVQCIKVSGLKINSTEKELKLGQMEPSTRASIEMAKKMGKEHSILLTGVLLQANFLQMKLLVMVSTYGLMANPTRVSGFKTKCMVTVI